MAIEAFVEMPTAFCKETRGRLLTRLAVKQGSSFQLIIF